MRLRFALAALTNAHFDNALVPLRTPHDAYLPRYAARFDALELAEAYHRVGLAPRVLDWIAQAPSGFAFPAKLWKQAVDPRGTEPGTVDAPIEWDAPALAAARAALEGMEPLREARRLPVVVAQFPPRFQRTDAREAWLARLLDLALPDVPMAVELRHRSWWQPSVRRLLEEHGAPFVWSTHTPGPDWVTADLGYVRFTGTVRPQRRRAVKTKDRHADAKAMGRRLRDAPWPECFVVVTNGFEGNAVDSLPVVAAALGDEGAAQRFARPPGGVLLPDGLTTASLT